MKRRPAPRPNRASKRGALPFVFINMAMSADGKIATANRAVSSFGSARDRRHLLALRARADAVMAGARTVDSNPVNLGPGPARYRRLRLRRGLSEYNLRIIVSRTASINPEARIFKHRFSPIIILTTRQAPAGRIARLRRLAHLKVCGDREIDFARALRWLRRRWKVRRLLCEGGGELNDALFRAGLVDEVHLTVCPLILGGRTAPTIADGAGASHLSEASRWTTQASRGYDGERFFRFAAVRDPRR
jgi:riboflavin-specific deaminase-like protein